MFAVFRKLKYRKHCQCLIANYLCFRFRNICFGFVGSGLLSTDCGNWTSVATTLKLLLSLWLGFFTRWPPPSSASLYRFALSPSSGCSRRFKSARSVFVWKFWVSSRSLHPRWRKCERSLRTVQTLPRCSGAFCSQKPMRFREVKSRSGRRIARLSRWCVARFLCSWAEQMFS